MRRPLPARALAAAATLVSAGALAVPPTVDEIAKICQNADGAAHCARLVEHTQMQRLPRLARREGDTLFVKLYPTGEARFDDRLTVEDSVTYALFDFINEFNAAVLWVTKDDAFSMLLLQRATGKLTPIPAQPVPSPDRKRFATADFCTTHCENQLSIWTIDKDGVRRELAWKPDGKWADGTVQWKGDDTLVIEYTPAGLPAGESATRKLERKLSEPGWTAAAAPATR